MPPTNRPKTFRNRMKNLCWTSRKMFEKMLTAFLGITEENKWLPLMKRVVTVGHVCLGLSCFKPVFYLDCFSGFCNFSPFHEAPPHDVHIPVPKASDYRRYRWTHASKKNIGQRVVSRSRLSCNLVLEESMTNLQFLVVALCSSSVQFQDGEHLLDCGKKVPSAEDKGTLQVTHLQTLTSGLILIIFYLNFVLKYLLSTSKRVMALVMFKNTTLFKKWIV